MPRKAELMPALPESPPNGDQPAGDWGRSGLVAGTGTMSADGFVGNVARAALHAIVDRDLADGTERFVVKGWNTKGGAQFFVELAEILQVPGECRQLDAIVGQ